MHTEACSTRSDARSAACRLPRHALSPPRGAPGLAIAAAAELAAGDREDLELGDQRAQAEDLELELGDQRAAISVDEMRGFSIARKSFPVITGAALLAVDLVHELGRRLRTAALVAPPARPDALVQRPATKGRGP